MKKKDLGLKIGTERQKLLESIKKAREDEILQNQVGIMLCEVMIKKLDEEIGLEQQNLK